MLYTVVAYRWGWTNAHHYFVACTADETVARQIAEDECDDRGGKYGVAVYAWADDRRHTLQRYFASLYGEVEPYRSERHEMFRDIGHAVHEAVTTGWVAKHFSSKGQPAARFAGIPKWLRKVVREREFDSRVLQAVQNDIRQRRREGLSMRESGELDDWLQALETRVNAEVRQLLMQGAAQQANRSARP